MLLSSLYLLLLARLIRLDEDFCWNLQTLGELANHVEGQWPLTVQNLRDPATLAKHGFEILPRQTQSLHAMHNRRNRVRFGYRIMFRLIGFNQGHQDV